MNSAAKNIDLYIFHGNEDVVFGFFSGEKLLRFKKINKQEIGEKWVEKFEHGMKKINIGLENIDSVYLNSSFSTWNSSRLITLFAKTLASCIGINFYLKEESRDKSDIDVALKSFYKDKKNFKFVKEPEGVAPLYKKCPNINI